MGLPLTMLLQIPRILNAIRYEHYWLDGVMRQYRFDLIISDNRYGLYHRDTYSVFITHQLLIKTPFRMMERLLQRSNYRLINRFYECWVPDVAFPPYLAGELAHPAVLPKVPVKYIGALSRLRFEPSGAAGEHLLVLLSGPEPQRSILEEKILQQLEHLDRKILLVRGVPGETSIPYAAPHVRICNHMPAKQLNDAFAQASLVISRCGYSTVMDLMATRKKSILIPTPGQTEQEYLAQHLMQQQLALCIPQDEFKLEAALQLAASFPYRADSFDMDRSKLSGVISELVI
jgi:predicted glycosyltransferase